MIEVGHPTQTSPFSSESLVPVALVLPVIVRFRMRFLVPSGPLLDRSIEERQIASACRLAALTDVTCCMMENSLHVLVLQARK